MIEHDAKPGPLAVCQITGSPNLNLVIDLGHQPPCDAILTDGQLNEPEVTYPLRLMHCPESGLAQLDYVVDGTTIYPPTYPYRSGISKPLADYQRAFAAGVLKMFPQFRGGHVVDIGSNDGTLLTGFDVLGFKTLGIEPTDIADIAEAENNIATVKAFFTDDLAFKVRPAAGAQIVTMTNVFAHMAPLGNVMRGITRLLSTKGVFITESHYLLDVLEKNQFDTIYHEHIRTYSLKSLRLLFAQYGMEIFHVERGDRYGGNIRVYASFSGVYKVDGSVAELTFVEEESRLSYPASWMDFASRVRSIKRQILKDLISFADRGLRVVGCSAPGRASTLLNYCGITPELMHYTGELGTSLKLGHYIPGCHIPIVHNSQIIDDQPEVVMLLAWHYADAIIARLRREGYFGLIYQPLPIPKFIAQESIG